MSAHSCGRLARQFQQWAQGDPAQQHIRRDPEENRRSSSPDDDCIDSMMVILQGVA
jgi:hypothetical protein